jgi:glycosyltransferase involved in cell wall biosynthesis
MKVLVNAISARLGGGQTYIRNLLDGEIDASIEAIYLLKSAHFELPYRDRVIPVDVDDRIINNPYLRVFWEKRHIRNLLVEYGIDVYFCPGGSLNVIPGELSGRRVKTAMTFQNMLPFDERQLHKYGISTMRLRNLLLRRVFRKSLEAADLVIFLSQYARDSALRVCWGNIRRSVLIPHGVPKRPESKGPRESQAGKKYLLYVSTLDVYKSQMEVIRAVASLNKKLPEPLMLYLVGSSYEPYERKVRQLIDDLEVQEEVVITGQVSQEKLVRLYAGAEVNIFASQTENCPFILLEAMTAGRPVACSSMPPMPEVAGDAVVYFDPADPDDIYRVLYRLLKDEELQEKISRLALERIKCFDLAKSSAVTWSAIADLGMT